MKLLLILITSALAFLILHFVVVFLWITLKLRRRARIEKIGLEQLDSGDFAGALETFEKLLNSKNAPLIDYINVSVALIDAERYSDALNVLDDAIAAEKIAPPNELENADYLESLYLNNRGVALRNLNRLNEALDCLETFLRHTPTEDPLYALGLLNYAKTFADQGEKQATLRVLEEVDGWFGTHEIENPHHVEIFERQRKDIEAAIESL